jgi:predicted enzyme related to lactoylglutathione lyase
MRRVMHLVPADGEPVASAQLVHLELHTPDRAAARSLYRELLGWRSATVAGSYVAVDLGGDVGGGIVECGTTRSMWLPYVEVDDVAASTDRARWLGAEVLLEPREGPVGWRSVVATPAGGELAMWQAKR